jgi:hypothetical protein
VQPLAIAQEELAVAERLTVTIDQLIAALEGPLERAAENAVKAGRTQLEETVKSSVQRISRRSSTKRFARCCA